MSLSTRSDRRAPRTAVLLALVALVLSVGTPAAAEPPTVPLRVNAVLPGAQQTTLVVDLSAIAGPVARSAATVTVDGTQIPARVDPVFSDLLRVAFVIDTSDAGRAALSSWLSAATRFVLEAPDGSQAVAVADTTPPRLIAPVQQGPVDMVRALSGVRAGGQRSTSNALTLALRQFPDTTVGQRVVVMYTTATSAGGESAAALSARFRQAGAILVVVGTAADSPYWTDAAGQTGGFFAPVGAAAAAPALDQVDTALRGRYLVQFATPSGLPTRAQVRVDSPELTLTGQTVISADAAATGAPAKSGPVTTAVVLAAVILAVLLIGIAAALVLRRRPAPAGAPIQAVVTRTEPSAIARGRASVPLAITAHPDFMSIAVARGRAAVPHAIGPGPAPVALPAAPERPAPPDGDGAEAEPVPTSAPPANGAAKPAQPVASTPPQDHPGPPWR